MSFACFVESQYWDCVKIVALYFVLNCNNDSILSSLRKIQYMSFGFLKMFGTFVY